MKCLIHVGIHHTATTSFQHFLYEEKDYLTKFGILYPNSILDNDSKQHSLLPGCFVDFHHVLNKKRIIDPDFYIENLKKEILKSKLKYCLISSEVFHELIECKKKEKVKYIFSKLSTLFEDLKILITTRNSKERSYSMYKAKIRQANEFKIFRRELFNAPNIFKNKIRGSSSAIKKWKEVGPEVIVKDMDQERNPIKLYFESITYLMNKDDKENIQKNFINNINLKEKFDISINKDPFLDFEYLITSLIGLKIRFASEELKSLLNIQEVHSILFTFIKEEEIEICMKIKKKEVIKFLLISEGIKFYDLNYFELLINSGISFECAFFLEDIINKLIKHLILKKNKIQNKI